MNRIGLIFTALIFASCAPVGREPPLCPSASLLATAERLVLQDETIYLTDIAAKCDRKRGGESWRVVMTLGGTSASGEERPITAPIFVAVLEREGGTLWRTQFDITIAGDTKIDLAPLIWTDDFANDIARTYRNANIVVGFVLTPEQLAQNRKEWGSILYPQQK